MLPGLPGGLACSVAFTGHAVIPTALPAVDVHAQRPDGRGASLAPDFLRYLAGPAGTIDVINATLTGRGTGGTLRLEPLTDADDHPCVRHARRLRRNGRVFGDERGLVTLADGLAGRTELSIELHHPRNGSHGNGRALITDALSLVPDSEPRLRRGLPGKRAIPTRLPRRRVHSDRSEVLLRPTRG